jgi:NodT family efflux transporter outer membrane factor (OMF) lipoprotein
MMLWGCLTAGALLSACAAVGPDYKPPDMTLPDHWHHQTDRAAQVSGDTSPSQEPWWQVLQDPLLVRLVAQAEANNRDVRQALARVRQARAKLGLNAADRYPTLDGSGAFSRSRGSENLGGGVERDRYTAGLDAGWELDIFGGVRRSVEAAAADLDAGEYDLRDVWVSQAAEVVRNYIQVRIIQARLAVAEENLTIQQQTLELTQWRFQAGLSDDLAAQQSLYNLESTRARIPALQIELEASLNRLAVLLGQAPGAVHALLNEPQPIPSVKTEVAVGIPAETLRQRPDVAYAERKLAAQTARIGVATAELYPKLRLSGSIGLEAMNSGDLFGTVSQNYSMGAGISWRIFDAGAVRRNIDVQTALQEELLARYEGVVYAALEEVENALEAFAREQERLHSLETATLAAQTAVQLALDKYKAGLSDFSNVLDAQRSLLSLQDSMTQSRGTLVTDLIALYKALGGGWRNNSHGD